MTKKRELLPASSRCKSFKRTDTTQMTTLHCPALSNYIVLFVENLHKKSIRKRVASHSLVYLFSQQLFIFLDNHFNVALINLGSNYNVRTHSCSSNYNVRTHKFRFRLYRHFCWILTGFFFLRYHYTFSSQ